MAKLNFWVLFDVAWIYLHFFLNQFEFFFAFMFLNQNFVNKK